MKNKEIDTGYFITAQHFLQKQKRQHLDNTEKIEKTTDRS